MTSVTIDAHQHFWEPARFQYSWMTPGLETLRRAFLPDEIRPHLAAAGVDRTVVVQAHQSIEECRWLLELASTTDFIAGVVGWVDLTSHHLERDLDELQCAPYFKGVRHQLHDEPDETWMLRQEVLAGFAELERRNIPYDLLVRPRHLKYIPRLREQRPDLPLVIDHIAKPSIAERKMEEWNRDLGVVAKLPNVWCKLSGMITEADWTRWTPQDLHPYVQHVVNLFGYDRVMFGSDWPVCTLAGTYAQVVDALRVALGPLSPQDARKVWGENACRFYRLD